MTSPAWNWAVSIGTIIKQKVRFTIGRKYSKKAKHQVCEPACYPYLSDNKGMAACLMGQAYNCGHGVPKSQDEAFEYWSYSPESDPSGITYYNLGLCYMNGTGTSVDYDSALDHFLVITPDFFLSFPGSRE